MGRPAKYGYTLCHLCKLPITVRPITAEQAQRQGYDSESDGEYFVGRCDTCAGLRTFVYADDVDRDGISGEIDSFPARL